MTEKFRFNNETGEVYQYSKTKNAFEYICGFYEAEIRKNMKESTKIRKVRDFLDVSIFQEDEKENIY